MRDWDTGFQTVSDRVYSHLTSGVTMMSNASIISGRDSALMFDTFITVGMTREFLSEYSTVSDIPIRYLVLSHAHGDHCHGAHLLTEAVILGHAGIKKQMDMYRQRPMSITQEYFPHLDLSDARYTYPSIYLSGNAKIDLGERTVELLYNGPCHTDHDLLAFIPDAGTLLCGDVIFNGVCPVCNISDLDNYIRVLNQMLDMDADTFVPGHGPVGGKEIVKELLLYMTTLNDAVNKECAGASEEEAVDAEVLGYFVREWKESYRFFESLDAQVAKHMGRSVTISFDPIRTRELQKKADRYASL